MSVRLRRSKMTADETLTDNQQNLELFPVGFVFAVVICINRYLIKRVTETVMCLCDKIIYLKKNCDSRNSKL